MKIFLIGFMGSGKSHAGKELASLLKYKFIDTDEAIAKAKRKSISRIFEKDGEDYFREAEKKMLRKLLKEKKAVIATGGGLPCFHDNMKWMNENGTTVYLKAEAGFLFHRLIAEKTNRPLIASLSDIELMEYISSHLANRKPFYEQAQLTLDTRKLNLKKLKEKILKKK